MDESEDNFKNNKDKLIKTIRLLGGFMLAIGCIFIISGDLNVPAFIFSVMGLFQIFAAPRVLEWIINMRDRGHGKDGE